MTGALEKIAAWDNRASRNEARYFFAEGNLEQNIAGLMAGSKCFVVGSKGAGKSAVLEHIRATARASDIVIRNRFDPRNFSDFCHQTSNEEARRADLKLLWDYYISANVCLSLAEKKLGPLRRFALDAKYGLPHRRSIWQRLWRGLGKMGGGSITLGPEGAVTFDFIRAPVEGDKGLEFAAPRDAKTREFLWGVMAPKAIEDAQRAQRAAKCRIYYLFDEVDRSLSDASDQQTFEQYLATAGALLSSVYSLRAQFDDEAAEIYPIVAIRSDIYEYITHSDKSALNSRKIELIYKEENELRPLLAHRLATALEEAGTDVPRTDFDTVWKKAVNETFAISSPNSIYNYISKRTLNRPRDFVEFLRLAAIEQKKIRPVRKLISQQAVKAVATEFSEFFLQEFKDELSFRYPFADRLTDVFRRIVPSPTPNRFRFNEFVVACRERGIEGDRGFYVDLTKHLFVVSVFGLQLRKSDGGFQRLEFRHRDEKLVFPAALDDPAVHFGLHTGILRALFGD